MHQEAIGKACNPAQAGSIAPGRCVTPSRCVAIDAGSVSVPFTVYAGTDFQEVPARSADIRLLRCALLASASRQTNKEESKQHRNKKYAHGSLQSSHSTFGPSSIEIGTCGFSRRCSLRS